jgi:ribose transport system substrate-binding protein
MLKNKKGVEKMKKTLTMLLVVLMVLVLITGCSSATQKPGAKDSLTIGYIMGGPEEWQQCQADGAKFACDKLGYEIITLNSDYTPEKEITNAEDLISKGVDAIVMFTVNAESGQKVAKMCNDADIPLFLLDGSIGEGEGKAVTVMSYSFYDLGYTIGQFVSEKFPGSKMVYITGLPGAGIVEDYSDGLHTGIKDAGKGVEVVAEQPADWDRAKTIDVMESLIAGNTEFSVAFVNNEDMATGAIQVLEENNMLESVAVIATGGSEAGINLIKEGKLTMTCAASPAYEGVYMIKMIRDYFDGKEVPEVISVPTTPITTDNIDKAITWTPDENMYNSIFN